MSSGMTPMMVVVMSVSASMCTSAVMMVVAVVVSACVGRAVIIITAVACPMVALGGLSQDHYPRVDHAGQPAEDCEHDV